jgi:hypothetical protein
MKTGSAILTLSLAAIVPTTQMSPAFFTGGFATKAPQVVANAFTPAQ